MNTQFYKPVKFHVFFHIAEFVSYSWLDRRETITSSRHEATVFAGLKTIVID